MTTSAPRAAKPAADLSHREIITIMTGLMLGMFLAALDQTIVATSIRTIADDLQGLQYQAWATTAYLITATISTPLYGKLSDIYGRKIFFSAAITIFVVGSLLCTLSTDMFELAGYRAIQGLGAGGLFSLALAIIGDIVPARERAKYQGYFLAVFGTSSVLGPVVGGFLSGTDTILGIAGWRWVFLVNVPIGLIAFLVVQRTLKLHHTRLEQKIDWWGAAALAGGLVPLLLVAEQGREWGWTSALSLSMFALTVVMLSAFVMIEKRMGEAALLPFDLFASRTVRVASIASVLLGMAMFGGLASLPLYLQIVKGATPTEAGLLLLPMTLGIMTGSIVSGQAISRTGRYRIFPVVGSGLLTVALLGMSFIEFNTSLLITMSLMGLFGLGLGGNMQPLTLAVQTSVKPQMIGVATASATFTRQMGGTLGTAVFLSLLFTQVPGQISDAMTKYASTSTFQTALADPANAAFAAQFSGAEAGSGQFDSVLNDSSFLTTLDPRLAEPYLVGFSEAIDSVFLLGAGVALMCFIVLLFLPNNVLPSKGERPANAPRSADN